jgi:F420-dependent oxidoreductase-like protein
MEVRICAEAQEGANVTQQLTLARSAETHGFDGFFRSDHLLPIGRNSGHPGPTDTWVTLGAIALVTTHVRIGSLVASATFRLPGLLAVAAAEIDEMSGGRLEVGLGAGWYAAEHTTHGIPFPPVGERFERLEEQVEILKGLWRTAPGERFTFRGRHYDLDGAPALPRPHRPGGPPLILGGFGTRRTPRLAARFADEFNMSSPTTAQFRRQLERVWIEAEAVDRDPATIVPSVALLVCCGRRADEVDRRVSRTGMARDAVDALGVAGHPDAIVERVQEFAAAGARRVYLDLVDLSDLDHLDLLAGEVLGPLRSLQPAVLA